MIRSLKDKLQYEVITSFNSDIISPLKEPMFDEAIESNIGSLVGHECENSQEHLFV